METYKEDRDWSSILKKCFKNTRYRGTLEKEKRLIQELASEGKLGENVTVLCCGDGREMGDILDANQCYPQVKKLTGIDLLETSIQQVQDQIDGVWADYNVEVEVKKEDALATSINKHTQDTIFILLTMVNFDNEFIDSIMSHVYELLKPDGRFVFSVFNENALDTRLEVYEGFAPIKWYKRDGIIVFSDVTENALDTSLHVDEGMRDGYVKFEDDWPEAEFSRQFTSSDIYEICERSGFARPELDSSFITHLAVVQKQSYVDQLNAMHHSYMYQLNLLDTLQQSYVDQLNAQRRNTALIACALFLMMINNMYANQGKQECYGAVTTMEVAPGGGTYDFCIED